MKRVTGILITLVALLLWLNIPVLAIPDFAKAIQYTPPPNYGSFELNHDPGDNPFSGDGPGFMLLANDQNGEIIFQVGLIGFTIGEGKVLRYQHVGPKELKKCLEASGDGVLPASPPVVLEKIGGLTAATWRGELSTTPGSRFKTAFIELCWAQIETNIVLKITATAHDATAFAALTNSLRSLQINKAQLLESLQPKKPLVSTIDLDSVDVGYMQWRGQRTAALVFRCKDRFFSFAAADGDKPEDTVKIAVDALEKMRDLPRQPDGLRMAIVKIGRTGGGREDFQTMISFLAETNRTTIAQLKREEYRVTPLLMAWESWTNREPEAFQRVGEYRVNATLFIRRDR